MTATAYTGTVEFTSSDSQALLPFKTTLTNGVGNFSTILKNTGTQTLTATDTTNGVITGSAVVDSLAVAPFVQSINLTTPAGPFTPASSVTFTVTFSDSVTGVNAGDFQLALGGTVAATITQVTPVSGAVYTVTVGGITGGGTLGLNLADNGSIRDLAGNLLTQQNATAAFQPQQTFATGVQPNAVVMGDVNGDGIPDLVVANANIDSVSVLLGNGNGTFQAQRTFGTGIDPRSVALGDVNGDGKPDIVVANGYGTRAR